MRLSICVLMCVAVAACGKNDAPSLSKASAGPTLEQRHDGFEDDAQALFSELATLGTSDLRRDELVTKLSERPFSEVGPLAVHTMYRSKPAWYPVSGLAPKTNKPWMEEQYSEDHKIDSAASAIWNHVLCRLEPDFAAKQLGILGLKPAPEKERLFFLFELQFRTCSDESLRILDQIARDREQPAEIAVEAGTLLIQKADANTYLPLLIENCDRVRGPLPRSEKFRFATEMVSPRLSPENKKLLVRYGFALLGLIDDRKTGLGYGLAIDLGRALGIKPIRDVQSPFQPDQRLTQYQGEFRPDDSFFQDTVNNAMAWWQENKGEYTD